MIVLGADSAVVSASGNLSGVQSFESPTKQRTKRRLPRKSFDRFYLMKTIEKRRFLTSEKQNSSTRLARNEQKNCLYFASYLF